jgi:hypothetical protein
MHDKPWRLKGNAPELVSALRSLNDEWRSYATSFALAEIVGAGFVSARTGYAFPDDFRALAAEARGWLDSVDRAPVVAKCAVDLLSANAEVWAAYKSTQMSPRAQSRRLISARELGVAETLFHAAKAGLIDNAALAQIRAEAAIDRGKQSGVARRRKNSHHRDRARKAWRAYKGNRPRTAWAKANAKHYDVNWRTLDGWLTAPN